MRILEPMMLLLLERQPAHGYLLVEQLAETFDFEALPQQTVYRTLQKMEEAGWIRANWDMDSVQGPPRKVYHITPEGKGALDAWSEEMAAMRERLDAFMEIYAEVRESREERK
jgi:DNA-binding PadR family transcriptional regulator